jgi:hypothetical protein
MRKPFLISSIMKITNGFFLSSKIFCMKELKSLFVLVIFSILFFSMGERINVAAQTIITVGEGATDMPSIEDAFDQLPENCGETIIRLNKSVDGDPIVSLSIPINKGITSLTIENSDLENSIVIETISEIFANGIPFILGEKVSLPNGWVFGGSKAENGKIRNVKGTNITILGSSAYAFGGGAALNGGRSFVSGQTSVVLGRQGKIFWEIFGGGYAAGVDSISEVSKTSLSIFGTADYVLGGGLAKENGRVVVSESTSVTIESGGTAAIGSFGGGNAVGQGSISETKMASSIIYGAAAWAFGGDFTYQGGQSFLTGTAEITVAEGAHVKSLYGGSFATDMNSYSEVNQSVVHIKGTAESADPEGETSYGGISVVKNATSIQ